MKHKNVLFVILWIRIWSKNVVVAWIVVQRWQTAPKDYSVAEGSSPKIGCSEDEQSSESEWRSSIISRIPSRIALASLMACRVSARSACMDCLVCRIDSFVCRAIRRASATGQAETSEETMVVLGEAIMLIRVEEVFWFWEWLFCEPKQESSGGNDAVVLWSVSCMQQLKVIVLVGLWRTSIDVIGKIRFALHSVEHLSYSYRRLVSERTVPGLHYPHSISSLLTASTWKSLPPQ
jgi:hypothetical protein